MIERPIGEGAARTPAAGAQPASGESARLAHAPRFSVTLTIIAFCIFLLGLLWGSVIVDLRIERETDIRNAVTRVSNLARAFEEHTMRVMRETDQLLRFIGSQYRAQGGAPDLPGLMRDGTVDVKIYNQISVVGENGDLLLSARAYRPLNISDREHFKAHSQRDTGQIIISKPLQARTTGEWSLFLSRRINKPDGSFGGIVVAGVNPAYFSQFYADLDLGQRGVVALVGRDDGIVRARRSGKDVTIGQDLRNASMFKQLEASPNGSYRTDRSVIDGTPRIYSYRALKNYPLVVSVGVATEEALAASNENARQHLLAAALASLVILGFTTFLLTLVSRRESMAKILRERNVELITASATNAQLAAIVETAADAVVSCAFDGTVLSWNPGAERMLGYGTSEMIGRNISVIAPPDRLHETQHHVWLLQHDRSVPPFETVRTAKGGRNVEVQMSLSAIPDSGGGIAQIAYIFRDVTERKQAEKAARESEERFRATFDQAAVGIAHVAPDGRWLRVNRKLCDIVGYGRDELLQKTFQDITHPDDLDADLGQVRRMLGREIDRYSMEKRYFRKSGEVVWINLTVSLLWKPSGEPDYFISVVEDISERKRAEADLARLAAIVEGSQDAIVSRGLDRTILTWNSAAERMFGWSAAEAIGKSIWLIVPPERRGENDSRRELVHRGIAVPSYDTVRMAKDGRPIDVSISQSAIRGENGEVVAVSLMFRDIRERKQAEAEHAQLAAIIESSDDAIIGRALDGTITSWNSGAERLYGYTAAEAIGRRALLLTPPELHAETERNREQLRQGIPVPPYETVRLTKDGRRLDVQLSLSPIRSHNGIVIGQSSISRDITERKQAEQARANLAAIVENSNDAIIGRTLDGTITSWNAGAERLLGYSASEAIGRPIAFSLPPGQHVRTAELNERLLRGEEIAPHETRRRTRDGRMLDVMSSISSLKDANGKVVGASQILHDITAHKQAEEQKARLAAIVENSNDAIVSRGTDGTLLSWNPAAERLFGWSAEEAVGKNISIFIPPGHEDEVRRNMEKLHRGEPVPSYDTIRRRKDGQLFDTSITQSPIKNERGEVTAVSLIFRDITERKRADTERAQLAAIVESTSDAVISRDMDGNILSWNAAAERLFGWSAKEAIGQPIKSLIVPLEHRGALRPLIERVMRGEAVPAIEHTQLRKDGARVDVSITFSAVRDAQGNIIAVAGILRDIRPQKAAEREIRHKAQLAQLLEGLARAVNEADTPEAAMQACVARICDYGGWNLGRAGVFGQGQFKGVPRSSIWHCPQSARFEAFMRTSSGFDHGVPSGRFVSAALRQMKPVWVPDFAAMPGPGRLADAMQFGIRAGFVFPVIVGNEVAAFLEFFADDVREPDVPFLEVIATVSSQLARVIERQRAESVLKDSEERFRAAFEQAGVGMGLRALDPRNPRWLRVNDKLCGMLGYTRDELLQLTTVDLTPPEDRGTAIDYNEKLLRGEIESYTREKRYLRKDGSVMWANISLATMRQPDGRPTHVISVIEDITEHKQAQERAGFLAQYDVVTGLPNRRLLNDRLTLALARDKRLGAMTALLLLDLDRFKQVNETFGHGAGDEALQMITVRLRECLREVDTIARLEGDEFVVILESVAETAHAQRVAEKIMAAMAEPLALKSEEVFITASIGIALYPADADGVEKLIECAELAMYQAKKEGRNTVQLYAPDRESRRGTGLGMESRLRRALERDELLLHFQPKVDVRTGSITSAEALVRWRNPDLGLVSPADFIPLAEETGLIVPIGEWVLHSACTQASAWGREGHSISVAVNLSARQFRQNELCETVERALADSALDAGRLELEITESMIMHRPEQTIATLQRLHGIGVKLSVDDFGTGYSSLSYLKRFPVHTLKIDQSFVRELHKNADDAAIVRAVIALAHSLNLKTIAEGVETEQQLIYLAGLHCDEYQGYYFSKPLSADDFLRLLRERSTASPVSPIRQPAKAAPSRSRRLR